MTLALPDSLKAPMPGAIRPMWVEDRGIIPNKSGYISEVKFDGYRALAYIADGQAELLSRNRFRMTHRYPKIAESLKGLPSMVIDGEVVLPGVDGRPDFAGLRVYRSKSSAEIGFFVFDVLWAEGYNTMSLPLLERKRILRSLLPADNERMQFVEHFTDVEPRDFFEGVRRQGLEGAVYKLADSPYRPDDGTRDTRRGEWLKVKAYHRVGWEEMVVHYAR